MWLDNTFVKLLHMEYTSCVRKPRKKKQPRPTNLSTNVDVCGIVIDYDPLIICTLTPGHADMGHAAVAMTKDGQLCLVTQDTEGITEWHVVQG